MPKNEHIQGAPVTEEQINTWVAEVEAGIDVAQLKKRGRGRPGRGASATQIITLRLTNEELAHVDAKATRDHTSRSEVIRTALFQLRVER